MAINLSIIKSILYNTKNRQTTYNLGETIWVKMSAKLFYSCPEIEPNWSSYDDIFPSPKLLFMIYFGKELILNIYQLIVHNDWLKFHEQAIITKAGFDGHV